MQELFEVAGGSITGREHIRIGKNNQDAYFSTCNEQAAIAVVCDGCGSGKHSEVGAKIGARLVVNTIAERIQSEMESQNGLDGKFWECLKLDLLAAMQHVLKMLGGSNSGDSQGDVFRGDATQQLVNDYLLFTIVGVLITPTETMTFSIGDGAIVVNGKIEQIGPFPDNAPPYLAYGLYRPDLIHFHIHDRTPTEAIESVLIGTDGVMDLISATGMNLPGKQELVGQISQFWQTDRYFSNPEAVHRRLSLINRDTSQVDGQTQQLVKQSGLLPDDTTLVVVRRKVEGGRWKMETNSYRSY